MAAATLRSGDRLKRRRGRASAVAIALAVHAAFFLAIGLITPRPQFPSFPPSPPVHVILIPTLEPVQVERAPPPQASAPGAERPPPIPIPRIHIPRSPPPGTAPPSLASAPPSPGGAGRPGGSPAPGPLPYEEGERGVRAFLRATVGCETPDAVKLSAAERTRCDQRFAEEARNAHPLGVLNTGRHGEFGAPSGRDDLPIHPIVACTGQGSNFGVGCLRDGNDKGRSP
jgi:hypothetical protein